MNRNATPSMRGGEYGKAASWSRGYFVLASSEAEGRASVRTMRNHRNDCWPSNANPLQNVKTLAEIGALELTRTVAVCSGAAHS